MAPDNPAVIGGLARALIAAARSTRRERSSTRLPTELAQASRRSPARAPRWSWRPRPAADTSAIEARLAANPDDHEARFELAGAQMAAGDRDAAADALLEIIAPRPRLERGRGAQALPPAARSAGARGPVGARPAAAAVGAAVHMRPRTGCASRSSRWPGRSCFRARNCRCTFSSRAIARWSATRSTAPGGSG